MRTRNVIPVFLTLLVLASPAASSDRNPANACGAIRIAAPGAPAKAAKRNAKKLVTFSASSILDLKLELPLSPALQGAHRIEFHFYTPNGHLYQALPADVTLPASTPDRRSRQVKKPTATAILPVAGTTIVSSSLYGQWKVEAFLDEERTVACTKPLSFAIEP